MHGGGELLVSRTTKKMHTRNKIYVWMMIPMWVFVLYTVAFYSWKGWQWDQLFPYVLGAGGITSVMTACIAIANKIIGLKEREGEINHEV